MDAFPRYVANFVRKHAENVTGLVKGYPHTTFCAVLAAGGAGLTVYVAATSSSALVEGLSTLLIAGSILFIYVTERPRR